jgi:hypothetical protein
MTNEKLQQVELNINKTIKEAGIKADIKIVGITEHRIRYAIGSFLLKIAARFLCVEINVIPIDEMKGEQK